MKHTDFLAPALAMLCALGHVTHAAEPNLVRVRFREVDKLFANPGQGLAAPRSVRDGGSVGKKQFLISQKRFVAYKVCQKM